MFTNSLLINCNSWNDFQTKLLSLNDTEKGNAFELLTKLYFKINPVFSFYDEVWLLSEVPQKTLEYLKIHRQDLGIDLIAKTGDEYHAIQCKYHGNINSSVSFSEVATFIALFEGNKKFTQGYICSSANITSRNLDKITTKPITKILADTWQNLDKDFFDKARKLLNREAYSPIAYKPREHQIKALKQAVKHFIKEDNTRGKLIFPCGSGKSLTGYWITQELKSKATIIAVPSLSLVKQTLDIYLREIVAKGKKVKWLCICSDEGIGSEEDIVFKTDNLGVPCQTDPVYIKKWLLENKDENIVIFTTYQSGRIIAEVSKDLKFKFDVGIFDEAHKTVGSDKKLFSHLLFEENISIDKRIFMTATERFYAGSKDDIISMDDEDIYGDTFAQMSFKEAIEMELLTDYKVITIDVKKSEIADFIKENNLVQLNDKWKKETEARSLASMLALRKAMKLYPIKNAVSFHSSIDKAVRNKELQDDITDTYKYAPIDTYTVSGKMPTTKRNLIVKEFADSPRALITNARCLTEGVDIPNIDCIVFADPRKSKVDIVQALGRALRKKEGKDWGYVILPVVYDDLTQEIDNENFNEILAIVRGLASNDDRIIEYFKDKKEVGSSIKKENSDQFQFEVFSDYIDANQLSEQLQIKLWDKLSQFNWLPFEEAREQVRALGLNGQKDWLEYCSSNGRRMDIPTNPQKGYKDKGWISLSDWLGTGRIANQNREFLSYEEAQSIVSRLKLRNQKDWNIYRTTKNKLENIPSNPNTVYKNKGWKDWIEWLGSQNRRKNIAWLPFEEAREQVRALGLSGQKEWLEYCKSNGRRMDIPYDPSKVYKGKGWKDWGDWLDSNNKRKNIAYLPFEEARELVRKLSFNSYNEFLNYLKINPLLPIPTHPHIKYKNDGWISSLDFIGSNKESHWGRTYMSFDDAKSFLKKLNLKSKKSWTDYCKKNGRPNNLPIYLYKIYSTDSKWKGIGDFLGNQNREFLTHEEAQRIVSKLKLKNQKEWNIYRTTKKLENIPSNPNTVYKNKGWKDWGFFLGTNNKSNSKKEFLTYEEAQSIVSKLKLKSSKEWNIYRTTKKPENIPSNPDSVYKNVGWKGWGFFLGTNNKSNSNREYLDYEQAKNIVQKLNLKSQTEWDIYSKTNRPDNIPSNPNFVYKGKGWISLGDWLGTKRIAPQKMIFIDFEQARKFVHQLKLKSNKDWRLLIKNKQKPKNIPSNPDSVYKNVGWKGWGDFLGKEK